MSKQREGFEKWYEEKIGKSICFKTYDNSYLRRDTDEAWQAWQQAQKVAVPEGFVLVPREPTYEMVLKASSSDDIHEMRLIAEQYKAMIEAQEQAQ